MLHTRQTSHKADLPRSTSHHISPCEKHIYIYIYIYIYRERERERVECKITFLLRLLYNYMVEKAEFNDRYIELELNGMIIIDNNWIRKRRRN
jgi:hypothetical protein